MRIPYIDPHILMRTCESYVFRDMHPFYFVVRVNNHGSGTFCVKNGPLPGQVSLLVDHITLVCVTMLASGQLKVGIIYHTLRRVFSLVPF